VRQICTLLLIPIFTIGCGEVITSKHYNPSFKLTAPILLTIESTEIQKMDVLFESYGFTIDPQSNLHVNITTTPLETHCPLNGPSISKVFFIRISVYKENVEQYRIQLNQKEPIRREDIEKILIKMKKEIC